MKFERRNGVNIFQHDVNPSDGEGCIGKCGIDKTYTLEKVIDLAYKMEEKPNIIFRSTHKSKWYLKSVPKDTIDAKIQKGQWVNKPENIMYIIEWET
jgi:hypothetical protein